MNENGGLACSVQIAADFKGLEIYDKIMKLSSLGLIQMTPIERNIESFSLCLTEIGMKLIRELAGDEWATSSVTDFSSLSNVDSSSALQMEDLTMVK